MKLIERITLIKIALLWLPLMLTSVASGDLATVANLHASNNKDNFGGNLSDLISGSGMNRTTNPSNPATWRANSNSFVDEWQTGGLLTGAANNKIGWVAFDFGSVYTNLENMYIWNLRENTGQDRRVVNYNIYYSVTPTASFPTTPTSNTAADYDFDSGGWTLLNSSPFTMAPRGAIPDPANAVIGLTGVTARYIGIEILTNGGSTSKVGLAEVAFTTPEPSALTLLGISCFAMMARRRRR